jgi:DNA-directed RNA polymerase specialized sigma24 family protein
MKYEAIVKVYDESFYVNTETGQGFGPVLKKMSTYINKLTNKYKFGSAPFDDVRQELNILAVEGIKNFDPRKNVKLSTFLHIHLTNKSISKAIRFTFASKRASLLKGDDAFSHFSELPFSSLSLKYKADEEMDIGEEGVVEHYALNSYRDLIPSSGQKAPSTGSSELLKNLETFAIENKEMAKVLYMISFENKTISDIAEELGIRPVTLSQRIKRLQNNEMIKEMLCYE